MKKIIAISLVLSVCFNLSAQVKPLPLAHSHNDYEQNRPLFDALENGFTSVEADVLYIYGQLFVGHNMPNTKRHKLKTLTKQYLKPLYKRFKANNGEIYQGYEGDFYLWIDIKFEPARAYKALRKALMPYKEMLNYYEGNQFHQGKITVIISGDRPFRPLLFDDLKLMTLDGRPSDLNKNYPTTVMPFISEHAGKVCQTKDLEAIGEKELRLVANFTAKAKAQGKKVRLWATPEAEILWAELTKAGVDLLNTDDLIRLKNYLTKME